MPSPTPIFYKALSRRDLTEGRGVCVTLDGRRIAIFLVGGEVHAIEDECLHQGGPLSEGAMRGAVVICPWHQWEFNVITGHNDLNPEVKVRRFPVRLEQDEIYVGLVPKEEPAP